MSSSGLRGYLYTHGTHTNGHTCKHTNKINTQEGLQIQIAISQQEMRTNFLEALSSIQTLTMKQKLKAARSTLPSLSSITYYICVYSDTLLFHYRISS